MERILDEVKEAKSIGITGHIRPDGDCVGACMAMYMYLKKCMPSDTVIDIIMEEPGEIFDCIKDIKERKEFPRRQPYDVFMVIDTTHDRIGTALPGFEKAKKTINIDHHISNSGEGDVSYIRADASSASELVFELLDKDKLDDDIAMALYIGIIHDTGVLQYSNTSPKTLRVVADLLEYKFDYPHLIDSTFYQKTYVQNQILGRVLSESIVFMNGKCIVGGLDKKTMDFYGVNSNDMSGIVSQLRYTTGTEVAIFMYELESQKWKVSLRANGDVDVSKVAEYFGGGGHVKASGCNICGSFYDVVNNLSERLALQMEY
ncbi:MAG: bifunctional oligoribonuclease/PAP phosphatase NrnA [Lachnospiraceae bacterium]|nr:bifunctional oligoribonuclease/PAP phosphatase NrnA [Candidatus Colinaster equi]